MKVLLSGLIGFALFSLFFPTVSSDHLIVLGNGHAPIYMSDSDHGRFDLNHDGNADYFVKAHYTGNSHQKLKIDYKLQDKCVALDSKDFPDVVGDTYDNAALKIAFSTIPVTDRDWTIYDVIITNSWFNSKKNNDNKQIDLATFPNEFIPSDFPLPGNGDDAIQGDGKKGSFKHFDSISELNGQSGWKGTIFVNAPEGDYALWTIHPSSGLFGGCDQLSGFGIPIIIRD